MSQLAIFVFALAGSLPPTSSQAASATREVLPFIADDYRKALSQARARKRPLFVEAWAPW
jgi:hypothetical protein